MRMQKVFFKLKRSLHPPPAPLQYRPPESASLKSNIVPQTLAEREWMKREWYGSGEVRMTGVKLLGGDVTATSHLATGNQKMTALTFIKRHSVRQ